MLWLAAVRDAFSNRIVGWKTSDRCDTDLVLGALEYGIWSRDVRDGQLIHHSDRGSTYTAIKFSERLADNGILPSMGSVGDSYDNALRGRFGGLGPFRDEGEDSGFGLGQDAVFDHAFEFRAGALDVFR